MNMIVVQNLRKSFKHHNVLEDISFSVEKGQIIALLGSSGSGKSTLLRCINQLETPDEGSVIVDDITLTFGAKAHHPADSIKKLRQKTGMVFQQFNLWLHMTVLQNLIQAPLFVLKQSKEHAIDTAMTLLAKVGLANKADSYPGQLSGGQQQRVAIARALMMNPQVMLFDEPTSSLDPEMSREVLGIISNLAQDGMTLLIATHEIGFARDVSSHVMFLEKGLILEYGLSKELFNKPATERFRQFLQVDSGVMA